MFSYVFICFSASHAPWEGFLIFCRLVLIVVLTFVHDIQRKLFLTLAICLAIPIFHMFVNAFQRKRDNVLESSSPRCARNIVRFDFSKVFLLWCGFFIFSTPAFIKCSRKYSCSGSIFMMIVVVFCVFVKLESGLKLCASSLIRNVR